MLDEKTKLLCDKFIDKIKKLKLEFAVSLFLEVHKPISFIGSSAFLMFQPILEILFDKKLDDFSEVISKRENLEYVIQGLKE